MKISIYQNSKAPHIKVFSKALDILVFSNALVLLIVSKALPLQLFAILSHGLDITQVISVSCG